MGQDQSTQKSPSSRRTVDQQQVPYTSFSLPKNESADDDNDSSLSSQQDIQSQTSGEIEGIVSVSSKSDMFGNQILDNEEEESILEQLKNLPQVRPLIKSSVEQNSFLARTVFQSSSSQVDTPLDTIDTKPLIDIAAEFQTYAMQQSRSIAIRQDAVMNRLQSTELESSQIVTHLSVKSEEMKKLSGTLRDADRLNRFVIQCNQQVTDVLAKLHELEQLLPYDVKSQMNNPILRAPPKQV